MLHDTEFCSSGLLCLYMRIGEQARDDAMITARPMRRSAKRKAPDLASNQGLLLELVAHTGFGPVISSLRGTRPRPLDECAGNTSVFDF